VCTTEESWELEFPTLFRPDMTFDEKDIININRERYKWNNQETCM
jgi:hypothetical protein